MTLFRGGGMDEGPGRHGFVRGYDQGALDAGLDAYREQAWMRPTADARGRYA